MYYRILDPSHSSWNVKLLVMLADMSYLNKMNEISWKTFSVEKEQNQNKIKSTSWKHWIHYFEVFKNVYADLWPSQVVLVVKNLPANAGDIWAAAAAAKSLQSCPILCHPLDGSPPGSTIPGFSRQEHWSGLPFPSPMHESEKWKWSHSVMSDSSRPHGLQPTRLLHPWDFPGKSTTVGCHCLLWDIREACSIPGSGRSPGGGSGNPLQYSCLENPMDRGAWRATGWGSQSVGHNWSNLAHLQAWTHAWHTHM